MIAVALGLSFDTFAVSLSYGVIQNRIMFLQAARIALLLAFFQGGMVVLGYFLGSIVSNALKEVDHWIALGLLSILGIRMIVAGFKREEGTEFKDYSKTIPLLSIAIGTSIDAFAAGISFALLNIMIWEAGLIIGLVTFLASMTAIRIGKASGERLGQRVEVIGGLILIAIGLKIFLEHILIG